MSQKETNQEEVKRKRRPTKSPSKVRSYQYNFVGDQREKIVDVKNATGATYAQIISKALDEILALDTADLIDMFSDQQTETV